MSLFIHFHDEDPDWDETKVNRSEGGQFAPKGSGKATKKGKQALQSNFQFAPTSKEKHIVANEISAALKAHGYQKQKAMTTGGHYEFKHPSTGSKIHVGPAFPNQTYSKGWRHNGGVGGAGGSTLHEYLNDIHGEKEKPQPKKKEPQAKAEPKAKKEPDWEAALDQPKPHPDKGVHKFAEQFGFVPDAQGTVGTTYKLPDGSASLTVSHELDEHDQYEWWYNNKATDTHTSGSGIFKSLEPLLINQKHDKSKTPEPTSNIPVTSTSVATKSGYKFDGSSGDYDIFKHPSGAETHIHTDGSWIVYNKHSDYVDGGTSSNKVYLGEALQAAIAESQPKPAKPSTAKAATLENIPNVNKAPTADLVDSTTVNGGEGIMYQWIGGNKTLEIGTEPGVNEGVWFISDNGEVSSGEGQESLNEAFEALHPRDESGHFIKKQVVEHLQNNGFSIADENEKLVSLKSPFGDVEVVLNKETGSWKIYQDGHLSDLGLEDKDLETGLAQVGAAIEPIPTAATTAATTAPTPTAPTTATVKPPQNLVLNSEKKKMDLGNGYEDGTSYTLPDNVKLSMGESGNWSLYNTNPFGSFSSHIKSGSGQNELDQVLASLANPFSTPTPTTTTPTTPSPTLSSVQLSHAHTDEGVNQSLGKKGFSPVQTMSTSKVKYNSPSGSTAYVLKQPTGNGNYEWIYHPPGTGPAGGIPGTGLKSLELAIAAHEVPPKTAIGSTLNMSDFTKKGGSLGTTPGGTYTHKDGKEYYVKLQDDDHSRNESLAAALAGATGIQTFDYHLLDNGGLATEWMPIAKTGTKALSAEDKAKVQSDFAIHAWLANWDVAGAGTEHPEMNMGMTEDGKPICLDWGGALLYTGLGKPKGMLFGDTVPEFDLLRDPSKNPSAANLFKDMTVQQLKVSVAKLSKITNGQIQQLVEAHGPQQQAVKDKLTATLIARKNDLISKANALVIPPPPPPPPVPVEQVTKQIADAFERYTTEGYDYNTANLYTKAYHALGTHAPPMSTAIASSLSHYKSHGYMGTNKNARKDLAANDPHVKNITTWLNTAEMPMDTVLVRRIKGEFAEHFTSIMDEGSEWIERGFVSASLDPDKMKHWGPVDLIIAVPKGTKGAYVNNDIESEIVLQRGTKIKCLSIHNVNGRPTYVCEVTGQKPVS